MTSRWIFAAAVVAQFAVAEDFSVAGRPRVEEPQFVVLDRQRLRPAGDRIRILSYNLQDFTDARRDGKFRTPERAARQARGAASFLDEIDPDIALIEEVENARAILLLNGSLRQPYPLVCIARFNPGGDQEQKHNIAVLSRLRVLGLREIDFGYLKGPGRPPRGLLSFAVDLGENRRLLVYGMHLKSNWGEAEKNVARRYNALSMLTSDVEYIRSRYPAFQLEMLAAGDMNVDPEGPGFASDRTLEPLRGWVDLWRGRPLAERITLPTRYGDPMQEFPPATFDRIFVSPELQQPPWTAAPPHVLQRGVDTNNVLTAAGENDLHVSDHYPVWVDVAR
ncbi:MAG: endonuclease/exonuclease/phosphatase family protein [Verrucomicrobiota bacterium]